MHKPTSKISIILLGLTLVLFTWSCEEQAPEMENDQTIVGKWVTLSVEESECADTQDNRFTTLICTEQTCVTFEFRDDLTFEGISIDNGVSEIVTGTYSVNGNEYTIIANGETASGTFGIIGDNLTMNSVDADTGCKVEASLKKK